MNKQEKEYIQETIDDSISKTIQAIGLIDIRTEIGTSCSLIGDMLKKRDEDKKENQKTYELLMDIDKKLFRSNGNKSYVEKLHDVEEWKEDHKKEHEGKGSEKWKIITTSVAVIAILAGSLTTFLVMQFSKPDIEIKDLKPAIKEIIVQVTKESRND